MELSLNSPPVSFVTSGESLNLSEPHILICEREQLNTHKGLHAISEQIEGSIKGSGCFHCLLQDINAAFPLSFLLHHWWCGHLSAGMQAFSILVTGTGADPAPKTSDWGLVNKRVQTFMDRHEAPGRWRGINPRAREKNQRTSSLRAKWAGRMS